MKCSCGNVATGTLLTYYHDGYGIMDCHVMCDDCGGKLHNPTTTYSRDGEDPELRPRLFVRGTISKDYRLFSAYKYLEDYLAQE